MTDKGSNKPVDKPVGRLEDVTDLDHMDDLDVPTANVYSRTGKAAPTEVLPSAPQTGGANVTPQQPSDITVDRIEADGAVASSGTASGTSTATWTAAPETYAAEQPVSASTVSTAGALHTTEGAEYLAPEQKVDVAGEPQPPIGRGTFDVGLLFLRLVLGGILTVMSLAVLFQLGGNAGLAGLEDDLASHAYPRVLAIALPTMGLASGVFLLLGLLTPVAAMIAVAATGFGAIEAVSSAENMTNLFAWEPSVWLAVALAGMALAVQFTGPGLFGIDFSRSWTRRPMISSWLCAALGIAGAVVLWIFA